VEPNRAAVRQVTLDFDLVGRDRLIARHAAQASPFAVPGRETALLGKETRDDTAPDAVEEIVGLTHCPSLSISRDLAAPGA
jgi:hypothetical protein